MSDAPSAAGATRLLYYDDPFRLELRARVARHGAWKGAPSVVLDETIFYPEGGGQMSDRGTLGGLSIADVQVDEAGVVHHLLEGELPTPGAEVEARVDRERRRVHMALHTGQHMLSRALADVAGAETVSSRLGESACTIDLDRAAVEERALAAAEDLVNAVVDDDVAVRVLYPEPGELASLPLRRPPKVTEGIRIIAVGEFDYTPCGGTHCVRSAQVGLLRVTGLERYKGGTRVYFAAGRRARAELGGHSDLLRSLAKDLTCGPVEVPAALQKLRGDLSKAREALGDVRARLAASAAAGMLEAARGGGSERVVAVLDDADPDLARAIVSRLVAAAAGAVAFVAARTPEGLHAIVARGASSTFDCGAFFKRAAAAAGGRGGGKAERAEGRLPGEADWAALVAAHAG